MSPGGRGSRTPFRAELRFHEIRWFLARIRESPIVGPSAFVVDPGRRFPVDSRLPERPVPQRPLGVEVRRVSVETSRIFTFTSGILRLVGPILPLTLCLDLRLVVLDDVALHLLHRSSGHRHRVDRIVGLKVRVCLVLAHGHDGGNELDLALLPLEAHDEQEQPLACGFRTKSITQRAVGVGVQT